ncbi:MAG: Sua5/YciO/YrdC/YwlC family protein, partial [Lentisphaerota bacterium]
CSLNPTALKIVTAFCPGPITIIVPSVDGVSKIGFRIPEHEFVLQLIKKLNAPLAGTSANLSGEPAALNVNDALSSLRIKPSLSIDGGALPKESLASTVVEIVGDELKIIRKGAISYDSLIKILK